LKWAVVQHLGYNLSNFSKIGTSPEVALGQKVFYQTCTNSIAHLLQLLIDFSIIFVILNQLYDQCTISQGKEFCVLNQLDRQRECNPTTHDFLSAGLPEVFTYVLILLASRSHSWVVFARCARAATKVVTINSMY
jgi:hypothetical protein